MGVCLLHLDPLSPPPSLSSQHATPYCYCFLQVLFSSLPPLLQPCTTNKTVWGHHPLNYRTANAEQGNERAQFSVNSLAQCTHSLWQAGLLLSCLHKTNTRASASPPNEETRGVWISINIWEDTQKIFARVTHLETVCPPNASVWSNWGAANSDENISRGNPVARTLCEKTLLSVGDGVTA